MILTTQITLANVFTRLIDAYPWAEPGAKLLLLILAVLATHAIARYALLPWSIRIIRFSSSTWDDALIKYKVLHRLIPILPLLVLNRGVEFIPILNDPITTLIQRLAVSIIVVMVAASINGMLSAINEIYSNTSLSKSRPLKGYVQVLQILIYIIAGIIVVAALINQSPLYLLSGLGAMTAVLLLVFRDTLLSLVAGIQLTSNDLIRLGDWIEMPGFNADGAVVDIALNSVRVQNWDRTTSIIPTHKFLENSFKNWRTMFESGGRRIKRSIYIDMSTIRFLTAEEIERFRHYVVLKDYIEEKLTEIQAYNASITTPEEASIHANTRQLTNIGTFRAYVSQYLRKHPMIHQELTFLVRQLQPTAEGLPLEIYVFTNDTRWAIYEGVQADVFDHVLSVIPDFGLRVFQNPSGHDISQIAHTVAANNAAQNNAARLPIPASAEAPRNPASIKEPN